MELFVFPNYTFHSPDNKKHRPDFVMILHDKIILLEMVGLPNHIDTTERIYDLKKVHGDKPIIFIRYTIVYILLTTKSQRDKKLREVLVRCIDMVIISGNVIIYV